MSEYKLKDITGNTHRMISHYVTDFNCSCSITKCCDIMPVSNINKNEL